MAFRLLIIDIFEDSGLITKLQFSSHLFGDSYLAQISSVCCAPIHHLPRFFMKLTLEFQINFHELEEQFPSRRYAALSPVRLERLEPLKAVGGVTPVLNADSRQTNRRLSALLSAYLSVSKYGAVKLYESPGRAAGLPIESALFFRRRFAARGSGRKHFFNERPRSP